MRLLIAAFALVVALAAGAATKVPHRQPSPNVLVIGLGSLRADAIGDATPVLSGLAARGIRFSAAQTSDNPVYSAFMLLTGYRLEASEASINRAEVSIPAQLKPFGYRSFAVVANQDFNPRVVPQVDAFDEFTNVGAIWGAMSDQEQAAHRVRLNARGGIYGVELSDFDRGMVFASADEVLARVGPQLDGNEPFFAFVNFEDAHDPYLPDPARYNRSGEMAIVPSLRDRAVPLEIVRPETVHDPVLRSLYEKTLPRAMWRAWSTTLDLTAEQLEVYRMRYLAEVKEVDQAIGALLEMIERRGLHESTIVVVVSMNGEEFGETDLITHSFGGRGDRAATRSGFMTMVLPPVFNAESRVIDAPASLADVAPTLYDLLNIRDSAVRELAPKHHGTSHAESLGVALRRGHRTATVPLDQQPFNPVDDSRIVIESASDAVDLRNDLLEFLWGRNHLPDTQPSIRKNVRSPIANLRGHSRVDDLRVTVDGVAIGKAFHFVPVTRNGELVIVHAGHGCASLDDGLDLENGGGGMARTIAALLAEGYGVAAVHMPRQRPDDCGTGEVHTPLFDNGVPQGMRYFLEPVAAVINALTTGPNAYGAVQMVGLSGGGWTTVLYSALDTRIRNSVSVAGSMPLYLRTGESRGDIEQSVPEFYSIAGYPDLYVLAASEASRSHTQIFIANDNCCFAAFDFPDAAAFEPSIREYETRVKAALTASGGGTFELHIDPHTPHHTISRSMLQTYFLPALRRGSSSPP